VCAQRLRLFGTTVGSVDASLQAPVFLKLGEWLRATYEHGFDKDNIPLILGNFARAVRHDPNWYKAQHKWALVNFDVIEHHEHQGAAASVIAPFLVPAIHGFFRSIALGPAQSLQDTLRLLTLWFKHGARPTVEAALREGFAQVSIDTWLQVIPQIIARIASPVPPVRLLIHELLCTIGKVHPQALVYPLTVASKSHSRVRQVCCCCRASDCVVDRIVCARARVGGCQGYTRADAHAQRDAGRTSAHGVARTDSRVDLVA
jgi:FKBP12-rapamycin complex-associated protein